jgi:hypothetical protein
MTPMRVGIISAALALGLSSMAGARPAPSLAISPSGVGKKGVRSRLLARPHSRLHVRARQDAEVLPRLNEEVEQTLIRAHSADLWHIYDRELNRSPHVRPPGRTTTTVVEGGHTPQRISPTTPQTSAQPRARSGRPVALARKLRLIGKRMPRRRTPITWFTYYRKAHRSPYVRPLIKATSIALGASIRGYYSLTFGMRMRSGGNRPPSFAPVVRGW